VVDLGAGLDARPFRMALPPKLRWFEVDLPEVFEKKEPALEALGACVRIIVPADLRGRWSESLLGAGFEVGRPTLWLAEGLLFYLQPPTVDRLLEEAGQLSATGSRFAADVFGTALRRTRDWGPRTPFCCDDPVHLFGRAGWPEVATAQLSPGRDTATLNHAGATEGDPTNRTWLVVAAL